MEELISSSSLNSVLSCSEGPAQSEESSWTEYFVDFMKSEEEKRQDSSSYYTDHGDDHHDDDHDDDGDDNDDEEEEEEDSMISDAASWAPAAIPNKFRELKKLKKKVFKALDDDSLEDTASSPVNSPKVSALSQLELSPTRRCHIRNFNKEVGNGYDHGREGTNDGGESFVDQIQRSNNTPYAELKEKGLCLFPLSMLLHYHKQN